MIWWDNITHSLSSYTGHSLQLCEINTSELWLKHHFIYIYIHYIHLLILLMIECVDLKLRSNNLLVCCITLPQSLLVWLVEEAILDFFLLSFNFSPAFTISFSSFLQLGQYLKYGKTYYYFFENYLCYLPNSSYTLHNFSINLLCTLTRVITPTEICTYYFNYFTKLLYIKFHAFQFLILSFWKAVILHIRVLRYEIHNLWYPFLYLTIHHPWADCPGEDPDTVSGKPGHTRHTGSVYPGRASPHTHSTHSVYTFSSDCPYRSHSQACLFLQ